MSRKLEISLAAVLAGILVLTIIVDFSRRPPDFAAMQDIQARKQAFFDYLRPEIEAVNRQRMEERRQLEHMLDDLISGNELNYLERRRIKFWSQRYDIEFQPDDLKASLEKLLLHLDQIPASMVLAQAAMESAWGTSRFVTEGYNFFGQWCFEKGCGMVPGERSTGARHEVKKFESPRHALYAYFRNINSHPAYNQLREIRARARAAGVELSGLELVAGLQKYSERGQAYIRELRSVIRYNELE